MKNSSAKITLTLLAAAALGVVAVACTVTSGTDDDFDGGRNNNTSSGTNGGTSSGNIDSGSDANQAATCSELTYGSDIESAECQACLNQNCCAVTAACWNVATDATGLGCEGYVDQLNDCDADGNIENCKQVTKENATQPGIPEKYDAYLSCRNTNCDSTCNRDGIAPDGGPPQ